MKEDPETGPAGGPALAAGMEPAQYRLPDSGPLIKQSTFEPLPLEAPANSVVIHSGHHGIQQNQAGRRTGRSDLQRLVAAVGDSQVVLDLEQAVHTCEVVGRGANHQDC